ncbi:hypothetical protein BIFGAL_03364 [Bifidobacterium gallicum DSM 20093 = LMG 11596]|uniref:Uncharacterized protein n=1 Tax=Bifidobacterium gallicum DSM 20093 = LMG 11596 TaxID=561180 RepID=D1NU42_9BIFI|nr:hypothetical protein BIFGAL_03364 [Bifidobacterium gallicum DSM 20093 = LMG 11596]
MCRSCRLVSITNVFNYKGRALAANICLYMLNISHFGQYAKTCSTRIRTYVRQ